MHNFDELIDREGTHSYKYDLREKLFGSDKVYPMWVADTEFRVPDFITEALRKRLDHGIFGYTLIDDAYYNSIIQWNKDKHGIALKKEWIKYSPGVVPSLFASVLAFTDPGDKVIVQTPVYYPFYSAVSENGREVLRNELVLENGRYQMDLDGLKSMIDEKTKMLILCSPHNPTGNVWRESELRALCEICVENDILIISDEIHADIVYNGFKHIPTSSLSDEIANRTVTLMAPSKTFNIAGLNTSYMYSSNPELLSKMNHFFEGMHIGANIFAIEATKAALLNGQEWVRQLIAYYTSNLDYVREFVNTRLKNITLIEPEGTFLLWLDFRATGLSRRELKDKLVGEANLGLSDGYMFGREGDQFQRMNIGCSFMQLKSAMERIESLDVFRK